MTADPRRSSRPARADWRDGVFAEVIGDEHEFVPLPER